MHGDEYYGESLDTIPTPEPMVPEATPSEPNGLDLPPTPEPIMPEQEEDRAARLLAPGLFLPAIFRP